MLSYLDSCLFLLIFWSSHTIAPLGSSSVFPLASNSFKAAWQADAIFFAKSMRHAWDFSSRCASCAITSILLRGHGNLRDERTNRRISWAFIPLNACSCAPVRRDPFLRGWSSPSDESSSCESSEACEANSSSSDEDFLVLEFVDLVVVGWFFLFRRLVSTQSIFSFSLSSSISNCLRSVSGIISLHGRSVVPCCSDNDKA